MLPDGREAPLRIAPAWCNVCSTTVDGEILPVLAELERELAELEHGGPAREALLAHFSGLPPDGLLELSIASLRATRDWRAARLGPPRCLACGSDRITHVPSDAAGEARTMTHPSCGGMLIFEMFALGSARAAIYTVEGERVAEETTK